MHRRIEEPGDFVRLKVEAALDLDKRVIPLLVRQATMPAEDELPGTIARLPTRTGSRSGRTRILTMTSRGCSPG